MIFDAARKGLLLWFEQLVPALFPFLILSNLLIFYIGKRKSLSRKKSPEDTLLYKAAGLSPYGLYTVFMGHFCGYPVGARITADLYLCGRISRQEANRLLMFANQASPAFIASYLSVYAMDSRPLLPFIFFVLYGATLVTCLLTWHVRPAKAGNYHYACRTCEKLSFMQMLDSSITDAFGTMVRVGGYVILFSIFSAFLLWLLRLPVTWETYLAASLEMTNGLALLKQMGLPEETRRMAMLLCTAFGGFSTMAQIKGMLIGTSLSIKPYIFGKCIYTVTVWILARLLLVLVKIIQIQ